MSDLLRGYKIKHEVIFKEGDKQIREDVSLTTEEEEALMRQQDRSLQIILLFRVLEALERNG